MSRTQRAGAIAVLTTLAATGCSSKGASPQAPEYRHGYERLPERAKWLLGTAGTSERYEQLTEAERSTYEAITHALNHHGLLESVEAVTKIWGEAPVEHKAQPGGRHQFRLSVMLSSDAPRRLWAAGFLFDENGHVKRANGDLTAGHDTWSARERGNAPRLQTMSRSGPRKIDS